MPIFEMLNTSSSITLQRQTIAAQTSFSDKGWELVPRLRAQTPHYCATGPNGYQVVVAT